MEKVNLALGIVKSIYQSEGGQSGVEDFRDARTLRTEWFEILLLRNGSKCFRGKKFKLLMILSSLPCYY